MDINKYKDLPITVPSEKLNIMFEEVIQEYNQKRIDKYLFLEILIELMDRQTYTYEVLKDDLRKTIDGILCKLWNTDSYDDVDTITSIVATLGLENCFEMAKNSLKENKEIDKKIKKEIEDFIEEIGDNILDPFHDYK